MHILISHRGNVNGPNFLLENTPDYIDAALKQHYLCEVDVWKINDKLYLSHDEPLANKEIDEEYLIERARDLIIHCKNIESLQFFHSHEIEFHYFWHQKDDYTLTSKGWIWAYPDKKVEMSGLTIAVMPELNDTDVSNFTGICSDYIIDYDPIVKYLNRKK